MMMMVKRDEDEAGNEQQQTAKYIPSVVASLFPNAIVINELFISPGSSPLVCEERNLFLNVFLTHDLEGQDAFVFIHLLLFRLWSWEERKRVVCLFFFSILQPKVSSAKHETNRKSVVDFCKFTPSLNDNVFLFRQNLV